MIEDIVIIDDLLEDLTPISIALAQNGNSIIPLYFRNDNFLKSCNDLNKKNIRLIITDMELQTVDLTGSDRTRQHAILVTDILNALLSKEQLYLLIVWTTHKDLYDEFMAILTDRLKKLQLPLPLHCYSLIKNDCKKEDGTFDADIILNEFNNFIDNNPLFNALLDWENNCKLSAKETVNILTKNLNDEDISQTLSVLAQQVIRKNLNGNEKYAIYEALQPLLYDRINYIVENVDQNLWEEVISKESIQLSDNEKAKLNTKLHINLYNETSSCDFIYPGDFLEIEDPKVFNYLSENGLPNFEEEPLWTDKSKRCLLYNFFHFTNEDKKKKNLLKEYATNTKVGLLEISPACDFAQNKREPFKYYVLSILFPYNNAVQFDEKSSIFGNFLIEYNDIIYKLHINPKYLFSVPNVFISYKNGEYCRFKKLFRIRQNMLFKVIQDIANHNSRIGTICF